MHDHAHRHPEHADAEDGSHSHMFLGAQHDRNARRTWLVIAITATMMVVEIAAGTIYGSMALVADGWHMSTHAAALMIPALSYLYARRHARDPRFTFGTGKLGDLAGFGSAVILGVVALLIGWESLVRLADPVGIDFTRAILVAVLGLMVNLACALLLHEGHDHGHHDHHHSHGADNNLRAAYLHVLADALTSVLAIVALLAGRAFGWIWLDPLIGIVGALVIARWSWGLMKDAGAVLVDYRREDEDLTDRIRDMIEKDGARVTDLHVWQLGPGHQSAIVAVRTSEPKSPADYRARLAGFHELSHITVEVERD